MKLSGSKLLSSGLDKNKEYEYFISLKTTDIRDTSVLIDPNDWP